MKKLFSLLKAIFFISTCFLLVQCRKTSVASDLPNPVVANISAVFDTTADNAAPVVYHSSQPINLVGVSNRVITNLDIAGKEAICINLSSCSNITIKNCKLHSSKEVAVSLYNCKNIKVTNCFMYDVSSGVYASTSSSIVANYNQFKNMRGPLPRGQMVQFNAVTGAGNQVNYNRSENILGSSYPEDAISMYKSRGTPDDPIQIIGNWIRGGGPSETGGGICLGDNGGEYMIAKDNVLVNPGQYGIGIASGTHIQIINNKIYSKKQYFTNVGITVWNQYALSCAINTVTGNEVKWINRGGYENDSWNGENCGAVAGWDTNKWHANISENILPAKIITYTP